jgi:hypothetical protein
MKSAATAFSGDRAPLRGGGLLALESEHLAVWTSGQGLMEPE